VFYPKGKVDRPTVVRGDRHTTPGQPQGSHPRINPTPVLTMTRTSQCSSRSLCKGGGGVEWGGDPCGRPGVGGHLTLIWGVGPALYSAPLRSPWGGVGSYIDSLALTPWLLPLAHTPSRPGRSHLLSRPHTLVAPTCSYALTPWSLPLALTPSHPGRSHLLIRPHALVAPTCSYALAPLP
jgi:hypothetical protein